MSYRDFTLQSPAEISFQSPPAAAEISFPSPVHRSLPKVTVDHVQASSAVTTSVFTQKSATMKSVSVSRLEYENGMIRSTFKPDEPHLSLRRPKAPPLRPVEAKSASNLQGSKSRSGDVLRLGGKI